MYVEMLSYWNAVADSIACGFVFFLVMGFYYGTS